MLNPAMMSVAAVNTPVFTSAKVRVSTPPASQNRQPRARLPTSMNPVVQGPDLMAAMRAQAERFGSQMVDVDIDRVDFSDRPFRIWARGTEYRAQAIVVATGASALWLGLDSETRLRGRGVSACATCDGFFFKDREIAVVGTAARTALDRSSGVTGQGYPGYRASRERDVRR